MKNQPAFDEQWMAGSLSEAVSSQAGLRLLRRLSSAACARLGLPAGDVEDLAQDVVCRLLETEARAAAHAAAHADSAGGEKSQVAAALGGDGEPGAAHRGGGRVVYLRQVTRNLAVDQVRRRITAKRIAELPARGATTDFPHRLERLPDRSPSPEDRLLARERRRQFLSLCGRHLRSRRLRRRDLEIVRLAWLEGLSSREIERRMGGRVEAASVDSLLSRLRRRLRATGCTVGSRRGSP